MWSQCVLIVQITEALSVHVCTREPSCIIPCMQIHSFKAGIDSSDPDRPVEQHPLRYPSLCRPPPPAHRAVGSGAPCRTTSTWALSEASGRHDRTECNVPGEHDPKDSIPNRNFPHDVSSMRPSHAASKPTDVWRAVEVGAQVGAVYEHAGDRCEQTMNGRAVDEEEQDAHPRCHQ
jgi:hypothetical protein